MAIIRASAPDHMEHTIKIEGQELRVRLQKVAHS
jgi:hypothetical protein